MKKKLLALVLVVALAATSVIGGTLAYLQDESEDVNVMTLGNVDIEQEEEFEQGSDLYPGVVEEKVVTVTNTGSRDAYVRTVIAIEIGSMDKKLLDIEWGEIAPMDVENPVIADFNGSTYAIYEIYYDGPMAPDKSYVALKGVGLKSEATNEDIEAIDGNDNGKFEVLVVSQAIQTVGFETVSATLTDGQSAAKHALDTGFYEITADTHPWVDGVELPTFVATAEELTAALAEGGNVVLDADVKLEDVSVVITENTTLNLNGNTLTGQSTANTTSNLIKVSSGASLTISNGMVSFAATNPDTQWGGEGQPAYPGYANNTISCSGTLIIDGATIENLTAAGGASYAIDCYPGANLIINSGEIKGYDKCAIRMFVNSNTESTDVTINGGNISGKRAIWVQLPGSNISNVRLANLTINGGTLSGDPEKDVCIYSYSYGDSFASTNVTITGGTFIGDVAFGGGNAKTTQENVIITGGTFCGEVGRYVPDGDDEDTDSDWEPIDISKGETATVVDTAEELTEAVSAGGTVIVTEGTYTFPASSMTAETTLICQEGTVFEGTSSLDIKGATVVGATFEDEDKAVSGTINGTFKDCTFDASEALRWCYTKSGETAVFENCVINTDFRGFHFDQMDGNVIFRNCEINGFNAYGGTGTATFENCTFGYDESTYNGLNIYANTVLINCTFNYVNGKTNFIDMEGTGKNLTITNCTATLDGAKTDIKDFVGGSKLAQNTVIIDGEAFTK